MPLLIGWIFMMFGVAVSVLAGAAADQKQWGTTIKCVLIALEFFLISCVAFLKV